MHSPSNEEIIRSLYYGVLNPDDWRYALEQLRCLTNSEQAVLMRWDTQIDEMRVTDVCRPDTRLIGEYEQHYATIDPGKSVASKYAAGQWYLDKRDLGTHAIQHSEFYQDFLRKHGLASVLYSTVVREGPIVEGLSFQAGLTRPGFDGSEIALLAPITPHVQQAVMLRRRFQEVSMQAQLSNLVLNHFDTPIIVLDCDGRIMMSNDNAESWLTGAHSSLTGKVNVSQQIISIAKKICDPDNPVPVAVTKCRTGNDQHISYLIGLPLKPTNPLASQWFKPMGVIIVQSTATRKLPWAEMFHDLFGLSPAEARLLECLAEQESLNGAALALGISKETARSQLKAIFQKTGINKQATLLRLVAQLSQLH